MLNYIKEYLTHPQPLSRGESFTRFKKYFYYIKNLNQEKKQHLKSPLMRGDLGVCNEVLTIKLNKA